jgi:phosphate transport system substrate-binding protein
MVLRLAGSGTIGTKMALELATGWAKQLKLPAVRIDGGLDPDEYDVIAEGAERAHKLRVEVRAKGTASGLEPLLRGQADIWMASRPARESDLDAMRRRNVPNPPSLAQLQQPGIENVIGLAALAVIVNPRNPVPVLSLAQLRDIYSGKVTSWARVGGPSNMPIGLYSAEVGFGSLEMFCTTIIGIGDSQRCADSFPRLVAPRFSLLEDMGDAVAGNPAGIAFTDLSLRRSARVVPLATDCGTSVEPSLFRIKTDEYPLGRRLYFYLAPGREPSATTREFLEFTLSPAGQVAVAAAGFADLSPSMADAAYATDRLDGARETMDGGRTRVRPQDVRLFQEAITGSDRLSITFRFQAGTNDLDSRAEADLERLVTLMQGPGYDKAKLTMIGYSGSVGDYGQNRILSRDRAEAIRNRLQEAGVQDVAAVGVGPVGAVACNLDANTGPLNQRVEVWIRRPRPS